MSNMGDAEDGQFGRAAAEKEETLDRAVAEGAEKELEDKPESIRPGGKAEPSGEKN